MREGLGVDDLLEAELDRVIRRDWAVLVLDAWADAGGEWPRSWETCRQAGCSWVTLDDGGRAYYSGHSADAARLAAAEAVFPGLPADVREKLGERP